MVITFKHILFVIHVYGIKLSKIMFITKCIKEKSEKSYENYYLVT